MEGIMELSAAERARRRMQWPTQAEVPAYFGRLELGNDGLPTNRWEGRSLTTIQTPYPLRLAWEPATVVRRVTCHRQVAASVGRCLEGVLAHYGSPEAVRAARMDLYGGCYNFRRMRGGHALSMHSYGIAFDLDPERNPMGRTWQAGKGMLPLEVVRIFQAEGWTWGGEWRGQPDAMHFQAPRVEA